MLPPGPGSAFASHERFDTLKRMRRGLAWTALIALLLCTVYGFYQERLFRQDLWTRDGLVRYLGYAAVYWIVAGVILWLRPRWLLPVAAGFVLIYSLWWCGLAPLAVLYFLGSSFFLGRFVGRQLDGATAILVGLAIWILAISIAVHFPVNTRLVYAVAFAIPYLLPRSGPLPLFAATRPRSLAVLLFVLMGHWLIALKPEVSSDGLAMHLAIPMSVAHQTRWTFDFQEHAWALMPTGGDWAFTGAYLLGGEAAARLLNFALLVVIVAMVYQTSRKWLSPSASVLAAALFASTPLVQLVTGSLFVENVWAAMVLGAALALVRGELEWAGLLFGTALSIKIGTLAFLAPAIVIGAVVLVRTTPVRWRTAALAAVLFVIFAAPPYLNAWWKTGNPVYPFLNNVFHSPYFSTVAADTEDVRYLKKLTWRSAYDATFRTSEHLEGENGALGFQYFLLLVPAALLLNTRAPKALLTIGAAAAVLILAGRSNVRYTYPALPLFSIGIAWLVSEMPALLAGVVALTALNLWFLPAAGGYHRDFALFRRDQVEPYLETSRPLKLIEYLNRTAPGEPVAFLGGNSIAGLNARAYTDQWHTWQFWHALMASRSAGEIAAMFHELGIRHVIAPQPLQTPIHTLKRFVAEWTEPSGVTYGSFVLLNVRATPQPSPVQTTPAGPGAYDDSDPQIDYRGAWIEDLQFSAAANGSISYSGLPGDTLRFWFDGSAITYVYTKALNRGIAEVSIDERPVAAVNLYSPETQWQAQSVFDDLGEGPHWIEIRVSEQKDPGSSGRFVDLDKFVVRR